MTPSEKTAERNARTERQKKEGYQSFLNSPIAKLALSMIPPGEHPEAVQTLLEAAFNAGFATGGGSLAAEMIEAMFDAERKRQP